jgi:hypothetical protein
LLANLGPKIAGLLAAALSGASGTRDAPHDCAKRLLGSDAMDIYIAEISSVDRNTWVLVLMMCAWACMLIKVLVDSTAFAVFSYPVLVYSSLAAHNFNIKNSIMPGLEKAAAVAFATGIGMTIAVAGLVALYFLLTSMYQPSAPERPDLPRASRTESSRF